MIEEKVKRIMAEVFGIPGESIAADASNETISRWDSLAHMNLCLAIEEEFGIALDGSHVASMTTFGAVVDAVSTARSK